MVAIMPTSHAKFTRSMSAPPTENVDPGAHDNIFPSSPTTSLLVPNVSARRPLSSEGMCRNDKVHLGRPTSHVKADSQPASDDSDGDSYGYIVPDCEWKLDNRGCGQQYNRGTEGGYKYVEEKMAEMDSVPALGVVHHSITSRYNGEDVYSHVCEQAEVHVEGHNR